MQTINIHEAKTHFSKLVDAVMDGEEVIIAKAGKPAVKLVRLKQPKRFGLSKVSLNIRERIARIQKR